MSERMNSVSDIYVSWCVERKTNVQVVEFHSPMHLELEASLWEETPGVWAAEITSHHFSNTMSSKQSTCLLGVSTWLAMQLACHNIHWGSKTTPWFTYLTDEQYDAQMRTANARWHCCGTDPIRRR